MAREFVSARLKLARERRGLTKSMLADAVQVTVRAVTAWEAGESIPGRRHIELLATVLEFPNEFFFAPALYELNAESISFRKLSKLQARKKAQSLSAVALTLEFSNWIESRFSLPKPTIPLYRNTEPEVAAASIRTEWGLGELPIRNMIHLLEAHGVRVFSLAEECRELDACSFWQEDRPYVFLNTIKSSEHSRHDAAHELGHLVLEHWKTETQGRQAEAEADQFASSFLMPRGAVVAQTTRGATLGQIVRYKQIWNVSVVSLLYRMHKVGMLTDWQYRWLMIEASQAGYRTKEPNGSPPERSQVLEKVLASLRDERITMSDIAADISLYVSELGRMVFGLALATIGGTDSGKAKLA